MKKSIIALAVASAIAAPAAMADVTLYGVLSMDLINEESGSSDNTRVERDDVILGVKGSSTTDGGLMVSGEIKTEGDFANPTLAYIKVGNESTSLWAGKFGNPANAADVAVFAQTDAYNNNASSLANLGHFSDEVDNAIALTYAANGFSAAVGAVAAGATKDSYVASTATANKLVPASDNDGVVAALGYSANGLSLNAGYETANGSTEVTGLSVGYAVDALSARVFMVETDDKTASNDDVDTLGLHVAYTMGATKLEGIIANDDYTGAGDDDLYAVRVTQTLGGGLSAYAEYSETDGNGFAANVDRTNYNVGMSFAF